MGYVYCMVTTVPRYLVAFYVRACSMHGADGDAGTVDLGPCLVLTPLTPNHPRAERSEILLRPIAVCVCVPVRGGLSAPAAEPGAQPREGKLLGWRWGKSSGRASPSLKPHSPHRPLQLRLRLRLRLERLEHKHRAARHSRAGHVLIHVRDPTWPNAVQHTTPSTRPVSDTTESLETRLLLASRGAALAIRGLLCITHP